MCWLSFAITLRAPSAHQHYKPDVQRYVAGDSPCTEPWQALHPYTIIE